MNTSVKTSKPNFWSSAAKSALALAIVIVCMLFFATIRAFPISLLLPSAEKGIEINNLYIDYQHAQIDFNGRFRLRASGARVRTKDLTRVLFFDQLELHLSNLGLMRGSFLVRKLVAHGVDLRVEHKSNSLADSLEIAGVPISVGANKNIPTPDLIGLLLALESGNHPLSIALQELSTVEFKNSSITISSPTFSPELHLRSLDATLSHDRSGQSLSSSFKIQGADHSTSAAISVNHFQGNKNIDLAISLSSTNGNLLSQLIPTIPPNTFNSTCTVSAAFSLLDKNNIGSAPLSIDCLGGTINFPKAFNSEFALQSLNLSANLLANNNLSIDLEDFNFNDTAGNRLHATGSLTQLTTNPQMSLLFTVTESNIDRIVPYLPYKKEPLLCQWLDRKLSLGEVRNATLRLSGPLSEFPFHKPDPNTAFLAEFSFSGLQVNHWDQLLPGQNLAGTFVMDRGEITLKSPSGNLGEQIVKNLELRFFDALTPKLPVDMYLEGEFSGDLKKLWHAVQPTLAPRDQNTVRGEHTSLVSLTLPVRQGIDLTDVQVQGKSSIENLVIEAPHFGLTFETASTKLTVAGQDLELKTEGQLNQAPAKIRIIDKLGSLGQATAFEISARVPQSWQEKILHVSGIEITGNTKYHLNAERQTTGKVLYSGRIDFADNFMMLPDLNWQKEVGAAGSADYYGYFDNLNQVAYLEGISLFSADLEIKATAQIPLGSLNKTIVVAKPFTIGNTSGELSVNGPTVAFTGKTLDLRAFLNNIINSESDSDDEEQKEGDFRLNATAASVLAPGGSLQKLDSIIGFQNGRIVEGDIRFQLESGQATQIGILPRDEQIQVVIRSQDAGLTLETLGIKDNLREGSLEAKLRFPKRTGIGLKAGKGLAKLKDLRLTKGPIVFQILSFLSLEKLLTLGRGFYFTEMKIPLRFKNGSVEFIKASAESRGLTFELNGKYHSPSRELDLTGTTVVMNEIGTILSQIPLVGRNMGSLTDAITGAAWTVRGKAKDPKVSVRSATF